MYKNGVWVGEEQLWLGWVINSMLTWHMRNGQHFGAVVGRQLRAMSVSVWLPALAAERALNYVHLYSFFYCRGLIPNYCANYFKFYPQLSPVMDNVNFGNSPCACVRVCVLHVCAPLKFCMCLKLRRGRLQPTTGTRTPTHTYSHTHAQHLKLFNKRHNLLKVFT